MQHVVAKGFDLSLLFELLSKLPKADAIFACHLFEAALEGIVLFLALALLFLVFKIPVKYAFPPSGLYVLYRVLRYRDAFRVLEVRY